MKYILCEMPRKKSNFLAFIRMGILHIYLSKCDKPLLICFITIFILNFGRPFFQVASWNKCQYQVPLQCGLPKFYALNVRVKLKGMGKGIIFVN